MAILDSGCQLQNLAGLCRWFLGCALYPRHSERIAENFLRIAGRIPGYPGVALLANALGREYHGGCEKRNLGREYPVNDDRKAPD